MKRELTEDIKSKLIGLLPVSQKKGVPFKPNIYKGDLKDFAPTIYVRGWTVDEQSSFTSELQKKDANQSSIITKYSHLCVLSIEDLIDLESGDFIEIPIKNGKVDYDFYKTLPFSLITSIYREVEKVSGIIDFVNAGESEGLE